jgi:hypothetical protein
MRRRAFLTLLGGAAAGPLAARAIKAGSHKHAGQWPADSSAIFVDAFRQGMHKNGSLLEPRKASSGS